MTERWALGQFREHVYDSRLCTSDKMLLLTLMSFMPSDKAQSWPNLDTVQRRSSMSRSRVLHRLKDLTSYDWIVVGKAVHLTQPGPKPNLYLLPRLGKMPEVPPHCSNVRGRISNLRRGKPKEIPEDDRGSHREPE